MTKFYWILCDRSKINSTILRNISFSPSSRSDLQFLARKILLAIYFTILYAVFFFSTLILCNLQLYRQRLFAGTFLQSTRQRVQKTDIHFAAVLIRSLFVALFHSSRSPLIFFFFTSLNYVQKRDIIGFFVNCFNLGISYLFFLDVLN